VNSIIIIFAFLLLDLTPLQALDDAAVRSSGVVADMVADSIPGLVRDSADTMMLIGWTPIVVSGMLTQILLSPLFISTVCANSEVWPCPLLRSLKLAREIGDHEVVEDWTQQMIMYMSLIMATRTAFMLRGAMTAKFAAVGWYCAILPIAAGTMMTNWLCNRMRDHGFGEGLDVLLSVSILKSYIASGNAMLHGYASGVVSSGLLTVATAWAGAVVMISIAISMGQYKVPLAFFSNSRAARSPALKALLDEHVPFKLNPSGMQPLIMGLFLLEIAALLLRIWIPTCSMLPGTILYCCLLFVAVLVCNFVDFQDSAHQVHEFLMKVGARVKACRPGDRTVQYFNAVQKYCRLCGGIMLAATAVSSVFVENYISSCTGICVGYTSFMIVVSTILGAKRQIDALNRKPYLGRVFKQLSM